MRSMLLLLLLLLLRWEVVEAACAAEATCWTWWKCWLGRYKSSPARTWTTAGRGPCTW